MRDCIDTVFFLWGKTISDKSKAFPGSLVYMFCSYIHISKR